MTGYENTREALDALLDADAPRRSLLLVGPPRSGKTGLAFDVLMRALKAFGDARAVMAVSNRVIADGLGDRVVRAIGVSARTRPVTTLSALAFRVIADDCFRSGAPAPRLLNGAEQDALLRRVVAAHLVHASAGELCGVCRLLRSYFSCEDWSASVAAGRDPQDDGGGADTHAMFERGVSDAFVDQLRDMVARMDELGVSDDDEARLVSALSSSANGDGAHARRLALQWRLAFALRREYRDAVAQSHPGGHRLDASQLLVEGALSASRSDSGDLPELLVVDDFQDATLAGLRFLETLSARGVRLLLVGNPDEAVQTFRGSYPEYLFARAVHGPIRARMVPVPGTVGAGSAPSYLDVVSARVSLSIPSPQEEDTPLPMRPGKMPAWDGAWPIRRLDGAHAAGDGSLHALLYRSAREELDDVVWRIKRTHLDGDVQWNDMAVLAHDNATVRVFGERLRRDGVPVRYSSVTRALKDEPFVQGLFALIELARLRRQGMGCGMPLDSIASYVRSRVTALMSSPFVTTGSKAGEGRPARIGPVESAMTALESLVRLVGDDDSRDAGDDGDAGNGGGDPRGRRSLPLLIRSWDAFKEAWRDAHPCGDVEIDDALVSGGPEDGNPEGMAFGVAAQYVMLAMDDAAAPASDALGVLGQVMGADPQMRAFTRLWRLVGTVADGLGRLESGEPQFALALAWDATGVARLWQRQALDNTAEGRLANDRLDAAMRLFQYAEGGAAGHDIVSFIAQVRSMRIEADSLARLAPVEQAVTLTTPAGSSGRHWRYVWIPAVQQDVWPNMAERNTMFGGEELAALLLHGDFDARSGAPGAGAGGSLSEVLSSEKKSFLVVLTRVEGVDKGGSAAATVSAVLDDDTSPSDFLYGFLPERFDRESGPVFSEVGHIDRGDTPDKGGSDAVGGESVSAGSGGTDEPDELAGLDADPRGLVTAARAVLARHGADSPRGADAVATLALLASHGVAAADPANWSYPVAAHGIAEQGCGADPDADGERDRAPVVSLSPSAVDRLWECPVCWMLENRFAGPRPSGAATGFGTLIHAVAQQGSEEGLDLPTFMAGSGVDERIGAVSARLREIYETLRTAPADLDDPASRYIAMRKDEQAADTLSHIAAYFVNGNRADYLGANAKRFAIGSLERVACEKEFAARFDLNDILAAYNAVPGIDRIDRTDLGALMGTLVGGWPEGMRDDLVVRLSGRIDRMETRLTADGRRAVRLIDYKTGQVPSTRQRFDDLQLVCYQLGLAFPETDGGGMTRGARALAAAPLIEQSALFHVESHDAPAQSFAPEGLFQPPLFVDGALNPEAFTQRHHYPDLMKVTDMPSASGWTGGDGRIGERLRALDGTQALWALTMIARVFYAAAASRSDHLAPHPTARHLDHCRMRSVCPACAGQVDTVYETRRA